MNPKLITKIMRDLAITGLPGLKKGRRNLVNVATYEDLVNREFHAKTTNALWLTDITEHPTREGKVYCCCVLDIYSRKVVGWAIDRNCEATLVNDALSMAARSRLTSPSTVIHSDHGSQFTSEAFTSMLREAGVAISMDGVGRAIDNVFIERLWRTLKYDHVYLNPANSGNACRDGITEFLTYYNEERPHSSLNDATPDEVYYQSRLNERAA